MNQTTPVPTAPPIDRARLCATLTTVLDLARPTERDIPYRLVGTAAAMLHGVDLPVGDVDILVRRREDVNAFAAALVGYPCLESPAWLPEVRQYYANYDVNGIEVGISTVEVEADTDVIETFGRGPWEHYVIIACGAHGVPTVALELRLMTELYRGRRDRYEPIIAYLRGHGTESTRVHCDLDLIKRGLTHVGLAPLLCESVLMQLQGRSLCE